MATLGETAFPDGGRYAPVRLLGRGGMGAVYEAEDRARGGRVALKVMLRQDPERLLRFKREFRLLADLHHPNLVRLFDLSVEEDCWFFTMELVDGQPLTALLDRRDDLDAFDTNLVGGTASLATIVDRPGSAEPAARSAEDAEIEAEGAFDAHVFRNVVGQLLDALEHLHERGIVHRDLKPSNVLVDVTGKVRLLDFGLASRLDRSQDITADGVVAGTVGYMAPEQAMGEAATPASDLYALGCLMFRLLTGRPPFEGSEAQILRGHLHGAPPRVDRRVRGVPPKVADLCARLLARDPAQRPTIAEVRAALDVRRGHVPLHRVPADGGASFVGREAELSTLRACLDRTSAGSAALVVVSGPSGVGKSTLVDRAIDEAVARGHQAFRGRCYEREQVPFMTLDRAVDAMIVALAAWPAEKLRPHRDAFRDLQRPFPAMAMLTDLSRPSELRPREGAAPADIVRTYRRFADVLALLAEDRPALLALDDLQWADDESVDLLEVLLAEPRGRLTVIGTCREEALDVDRPARRLLSVAGAAGTSIPLAPLARDEARGLLDSVAGDRIEPSTRAAIIDQAGGNPFLLVELAHGFSRDARSLHPAPEGGVASVLLADLSPEASRLLAIAATAGGDISERLLAEAAGIRGAELDGALQELFARRLVKRLAAEPVVRRARDGDDASAAGLSRRLDLYHDRIREAAYQRLPPERRRALHEDIARILEANVSSHARDVEALLRHWTLAGDVARRRRFAREASVRAEQQLAYRHAARLLRIVLESPDPAEPAEEITARWERLGDLHAWSGQLTAAAEAYERALEGWEAAGAGEARTLALLRLSGRLGEARMLSGRIPEGLAALERGARLAGFSLHRSAVAQLLVLIALAVRVAIAPLLPRARGRDGGAIAPAQLAFLGSVVRSVALVSPRKAIEAALRNELLAWRVRDLRVLVRALAMRALVPMMLGRLSPRGVRRMWLTLREADAFAREAGDADGACVVRAYEGLLALRTDLSRGRATLEAALAGLSERGMDDAYDGILIRGYLLIALMVKGDHRDALALADRELARSHENRYSEVVALGWKAVALAYLGRLDEAERAVETLRPILAPIPACGLHGVEAAARTIVLTARGRFADAHEETLAFERTAKRERVRIGGLPQSVLREAALEACLGLARTGRLSPEQRSLAVGWAGWLVRRGLLSWGCMGHRGRALLAHHGGDATAARRAIEKALEISAVNTGRFHRYVCLEAAREIIGLTSSQAEEAAHLKQAGALGEPLYRAEPPTPAAGAGSAAS